MKLSTTLEMETAAVVIGARLAGKVAFVMGGSRGIGADIVKRLAQEGADVAFTYLKNAWTRHTVTHSWHHLRTVTSLVAALACGTIGCGENKDPTMPTTHEAKAVSVSINRPPDEVYRYLANPENFPRWAPNFCHAIRKAEGGHWIAETTMGALKVRFVTENEFRVADHYVTLGSGDEIQNPIRVVPNGAGSEVVFMVFRRAGLSDEEFRADWGTVQKDLEALKRVLEK